MRGPTLMVLADEVRYDEVAPAAALDLPEEKGSDGVALHQAVKERTDLMGGPYELPLNRRQSIFVLLNPLQCSLYRYWCLESHRRRSSPLTTAACPEYSIRLAAVTRSEEHTSELQSR